MNEAEINPVCRSSPGVWIKLINGRRFHLAVSVKRKNGDFVDSKSITLVGIAFILLGIVAFTYRGGSDTSREKIIDIGLQAIADTQKPISIPPLLGGLMLVGGIVLVVGGWRIKKSS
jgi:hypothetical protein